jgi:hypothetical protein
VWDVRARQVLPLAVTVVFASLCCRALGGTALGWTTCAVAVAAVIGLQLAAAFPLRRLALAGLENDLDGDSGSRWAPVAGALVVVLGFAIVEHGETRYFLQNDNFVQFGPVIILGGRSVAHSVFPAWNPYELCGAPIADVGTYALTYPPTYVSYFIARDVLGSDLLTIEVFAFIHLVLGYVATYAAARGVGLSRGIATLAALTVVLSGFTLIAGRSWYYMLPVPLWSALLVHSVTRLERGPVGAWWTAWTGLAIGAFFHAGNAQMWVYAVGFTALAAGILVATGQIPWRRALWFLPAGLLGLAVAAPLLVPQMAFVAGIQRSEGGGASIANGVLAMVIPRQGAELDGLSTDHDVGHVFYSGTLFVVVGIAAVAALSVHAARPGVLARNPWLVAAALAFVLALGPEGALWSVQAKLPVLSKFKHPFKLLAFIDVYLAIGAGLFLERVLRATERRSERLLRIAAGGCVPAALLAFAAAPPSCFFTFKDRDYGAVPAPLAETLRATGSPGRIYTVSTWGHHGGFVATLPLGVATYHEVLAATGYDPLVALSRENGAFTERFIASPRDAARAFGVRCITANDAIRYPPGETAAATRDLLDSRLGVTRLPQLQILRIASPDPMAFFEGEPATALPVSFDAHGARVDLPAGSKGGRLVVNVLLRPAFVCRADGRSVDVSADDWGRACVYVPVGTRSVDLSYEPRFGLGAVIGCGLAIAALGAVALLRRGSAPI